MRVPPEVWKPYAHLIVGNGQPVQDLLDGRATVFENAPLAMIQMSAKEQVDLIGRLHAAGLLRDPADIVTP